MKIATIELARVDWFDPRALALRDAMDAEMNIIYGGSLEAIDPVVMVKLSAAFNVSPGTIIGTVLALDDGVPVGQAGLRPQSDGALEVKKVMVDAAARGRGISRLLMLELEVIAAEQGATSLILQTGDLQPAAIALYESLGYVRTAPYAPYELLDNALCYQKMIPFH